MEEIQKISEELFIFERMAKGDQKAFEFFFEKYYQNLCNFVNIYIQNAVISEEIVQDIFVHFWEKKGAINIDKSVKSYLFQSSKNMSLNYIRNDKIREIAHKKIKTNSNISISSTESYLDTEQLQLIITASVNNLPSRCREVFLLIKNENLSYKEIAEKMDISVKTVENQMSIALKNLKGLLSPYYDKIFLFIVMWIFQ